MNRITKEQQYGIAATTIVHLLLFLVLWLLVVNKPLPQEEEGVPVVMGNTEFARGDGYQYTEVNVTPKPASEATTAPSLTASPDEPLITQTDEPTVSLPVSDKKNEKTVEKPQKTAEQIEAERRAREAEYVKHETEKAARVADSRITGAFGKGSAMTGKGDVDGDDGNQGSLQGNAATGVVTGTGGYGTFDLSGRTLGAGGLPRPGYNVQDEGRVVVNITVNPDGQVIQTTINSRTNTANAELRRAALEAARQAVFNKVSTMNNQMGTITYYFKLK